MAEGKCAFCPRKTKYRCTSCTNMVCVVCADVADEDDEGYDEEKHQVGKCPLGDCASVDTVSKDKCSVKKKNSGGKTLLSYFSNKSSPSVPAKRKVVDDSGPSKKSKLCESGHGDETRKEVTTSKVCAEQELSHDDSTESLIQTGNDTVEGDKDEPNDDESRQREKILVQFQKLFPNLNPDKIHNYYFCRKRNCTEICLKDSNAMSKDKKFQHKWLFNPSYAYCKHSDLWSLVYIDGQGMFCALCREFDAKQKKNGVKQWNCIPNVRYRTETVQAHLSSDMHKESAQAHKRRQTSYFDAEVEKKISHLKNGVYFKIFQALFWIAKEEIPLSKCKSLLKLIEKYGVDDIKYFETRSESVLRKMLILISKTIIGDVVEKIKQSDVYGFLTDEVTDIANVCQLVSFVKYFDKEKGRADTVFIDCSDLLSFSETSSPNADAIVTCISRRFEELTVDLEKLVAFVSDGASVMTGHKDGVAAKLRNEFTPTMINVHCICHRLALACADTGDDFKFIRDVEEQLLSIWAFFKNSSKRLTTYLKIALKSKNFDSFSKKKKKAIVKRMKKACRTRWLSLHAGVDAAWDEFGGLVAALKVLSEDKKNGSKAVGILKKINNIDFLGSLCLFKNMLPILSTLSKTFQTNALNFSRITPAINKSKEKIKEVANDGRVIKQLKEELDNRLNGLEMTLTEYHEERLVSKVTKYANAICRNIDARFPKESCDVLKSFAIFDVELLPSRSDDPLFTVHGIDEINILAKQFFPNVPSEDILEQWKDFRYELLEMKTKYLALKKNIIANDMKFKKTSSEWVIEYLLKSPQYDEDYKYVIKLATIAAVTPVTNAWPERGASAVKRIKSRLRSTMKNDMLNALINISLNGPAVNSKESDELIERVVENYIHERHYKVPKANKTYVSKSSSSASTQTQSEDGETMLETIHTEEIYIEDSADYMMTHFEDDQNDGDEYDEEDSESDEEDEEQE